MNDFFKNLLTNDLERQVPYQVGILLLTTILLTTFMTPVVSDSYWSVLSPGSFAVGTEAPRSIQAPREYQLKDVVSTEKRRDAAIASQPKIFRHNDYKENRVTFRIAELFSSLREFAGLSEDSGSNEVIELDFEQRSAFERQSRIDLVDSEWDIINDRSLWPTIEETLTSLIDPYMVRGVVANRDLIDRALGENGVLLIRASDGNERELLSSGSLISFEEARKRFSAAIDKLELSGPRGMSSLVKKLGLMMIEANVALDLEETARRGELLGSRIQPMVYTIKRGQFIVRSGEIVSSSQQRVLEQIRSKHSTIDVVKSVVGYFLLSTLIITTVFLFTIKIWPTFKPHARDLIVISSCLIFSFLLFKFARIMGDALSFTYPNLRAGALLLIAPVAVGGILLEVTIGAPAVFLFTMAFALLTGVFMAEAWLFLLLIIMGNIVGAVSVQHCPRRSQFLVAGLRVAFINTVLVLGFVLLEPQTSVSDSALKIFCASIAGILSGVIAAALTPIVEIVGSYITDMKLLELASLDRPLLRELSVQAPGTWNHSVVMGQMTEGAAKAIGANSLLCRVGAYYHDVGKMKNPGYFIENQTSRNRHDKLAPSMSALIIKAHVKNGVELANLHKLPRPLVDFIKEHHGTSKIEYFYEKALKDALEDEIVDDSHYRYSGPRPQTKESGILMLADGVEAASRTLSDPTPAKIQGLVQKMVNKVFSDGELDESELTLRDLHLIAKEFTRVLSGIHHRRVEYTEPAGKFREKDSSPEVKDGKRLVGKTAELRVVGSEDLAEKIEVKKSSKKREEEIDGHRHTGETNDRKTSESNSGDKSSDSSSRDRLKRLGI